MSTDAITVLKADHKQVAKLFAEFEKPKTTTARRRAIVAECLELLTVHTFIENEILYPEVRAAVPDIEDDILESYEEHHVVDVLAAELAAMDPGHERFEAKFTVLMENVRHHVKEEEEEWFPKVRTALGRKPLSDMGARMLAAKERAPRSPKAPGEIKAAIDDITS